MKDAPKLAFKNKNSLPDKCSCYHCLNSYPKTEIKEWTDNDQTAICPICAVDAVIPEQKEEVLKEAHKFWFTRQNNR